MRRNSAIVCTFFAAGALAIIAAITIHAAAPQKKSSAASQDWLRGVTTGRTKIVDLTHLLNGHSPAWPGDDHPFEATANATVEKNGYFTRSLRLLEHYSTHMDAPAHFPGGQLTLDQIPPQHFFGPAVVIDVHDDVAKNPDYRLTATRIEKWEAQHGRIAPGSLILLRTDWSSRWPDQARYRNMDSKSVMHFPGYSVAAAKLLIERGAVCLGVDTLSIDYGPSPDFEVHRTDLPANLYNLENLANLDQLPESGAFAIALPAYLEGGSGGPVRVIALLPN